MWIEIPCSRCESPQEFRPKYRKLDNNINEAFVKCNKCNYEIVLNVINDVQLARIRRKKRNERTNSKTKEVRQARGKGRAEDRDL